MLPVDRAREFMDLIGAYANVIMNRGCQISFESKINKLGASAVKLGENKLLESFVYQVCSRCLKIN